MKPRLVGINHIALEVGSVDDALKFYGRIFDLTLRGHAGRMVFLESALEELRAKGFG